MPRPRCASPTSARTSFSRRSRTSCAIRSRRWSTRCVSSSCRMPTRPSRSARTASSTRQLSQMVRLVDDLLDVSRITSGKLARPQAARGARVDRPEAPSTPRGLCSTSAITRSRSSCRASPSSSKRTPCGSRRCFSNLLNNAAKYSEPGGNITLSAGGGRGATVRVRVDDHGIGISSGHVAADFRDVRAGRQLARARAGGPRRGPRAREAAHRAARRLDRGESRGRGEAARSRCVLPVMAALTSERRSPMPRRRPRSRAGIGSCSSTTTWISRRASRCCCRTSGTRSGSRTTPRKRSRSARELQPEFAFLDLGLAADQRLRARAACAPQPESASTVLIALSGWGQARDRQRSQEAGFALHLVKPVELQSIQAVLTSLVAGELSCDQPSRAKPGPYESRALVHSGARRQAARGACSARARRPSLRRAASPRSRVFRGRGQGRVPLSLRHVCRVAERRCAPDRPITIAVLGANAVAAQLRNFLPGRTIQGRPVEVRALARIQDLRDDELLFIGERKQCAPERSHRRGGYAPRPDRYRRRRRPGGRRDGEFSARGSTGSVRDLAAQGARLGAHAEFSFAVGGAARRDLELLVRLSRRVVWPLSPDLADLRSRPRPEP